MNKLSVKSIARRFVVLSLIALTPGVVGAQSPANNQDEVDKLKSKDHFEDGTFHDIPALIASSPQKKYWAYRVIFKDRDRWFEINLSTPDINDINKTGWKPYIESFRYEPEKQRTPAAPASAPVFTFTTTMPATGR